MPFGIRPPAIFVRGRAIGGQGVVHHLLRQVLENVASFLGVGQFGYVLNQIGIEDANDTADIINTLSHKKVYYFESDELVPDTQAIFKKVFTGLKEKYQFVLHMPASVAAPPAAPEPVPAPGVTP